MKKPLPEQESKSKEEILRDICKYTDKGKLNPSDKITVLEALEAMEEYRNQPLPEQTEKDCVNCPSNQFYLANTEKIMNEQERVKSTERQTSEEFAKMKDGSFVQIGCIDTVRDLWANINCDNHIDPATCKRETSCDKCDKYKVVYTDEAIEHRAYELAKIHSKQSVGDFTVGYLFGIKEPIKFKNY